MPEQPVSIAGHLDWLQQNLPAFRYGEIGLIFTLRDGVVVACRRVFHETFKTQEPEITIDKVIGNTIDS